MKTWQRNGILTAALITFGAARMPFEAGLAKELREAGLTPPPLEIGTRARIDQTSSAVALGGLRTLVATFLNLRAFGFFQEQRWDDVADTFDTVVDLAPRHPYYWETGAWHSAYNAASYYRNDSDLSVLRRKAAWRASIIKGRYFLERGIRNNPQNWNMQAYLGFMLSDRNKFEAFRDPDKTFAAAAAAYGRAADLVDAPPYVRRQQLFAQARVKGMEKESLALARSLYKEQKNRVPTLLSLLFVLESFENPNLDGAARAIEIFGSPQAAYDALSLHWRRIDDRLPVYGVAAALGALEKTLNIPADKSILNEPPRPPRSIADWSE